MQSFFSGISEAKDHVIAAVLLIIASLLLIGRHQAGLNNLRKASVTVFSYLEEPFSNIRIYQQALKTNTYLRRQNVLLLDELSRLRSAEQRNKRLRKLLEFSRESNLNLYPVQVVGKKLNHQASNSFTIDAGANHGVEPGMPMVGAEGLAGKVVLVNEEYAKVMPLYNVLFRVSAKLQQSNAYGIVSWNSNSIRELELNYVPQTVEVDTGEVVITSGYSNQFPPGIPIGKVSRTQPQKGKDTQKIFLKPFVNLYTIEAGFVIKFEADTLIQNLNQRYREKMQ